MLTLLLASGNAHKAEEFRALFQGKLNVQSAPATLEVAETGGTFFENALIKAKAYFDVYGVPTLADDSGLVLEAFPEILGVQSARFAPELPEYPQKCARLLEIYREERNRRAYFICVLCCYLSPDEIYFFEGRLNGRIGQEAQGLHGFGYDPIFIPDRSEVDGKTLAQLPEWKNEFSHRAKAAQSALEFIKESVDKLGPKT